MLVPERLRGPELGKLITQFLIKKYGSGGKEFVKLMYFPSKLIYRSNLRSYEMNIAVKNRDFKEVERLAKVSLNKLRGVKSEQLRSLIPAFKMIAKNPKKYIAAANDTLRLALTDQAIVSSIKKESTRWKKPKYVSKRSPPRF